MALPNQIDPSTPTGSTDPGTLDTIITGLKTAILDILGIASATNVSTAAFDIDANGLDEIKLQNAGADATAAGYLRRNSTNLTWHDGTSAKVVTNNTGTQTLTNKTLTSPTISGPTFSGTASGTLTSLTLVTPALGTPASGTLTNCTLPVGGVTGLGTGVATFLATPSSANLRSAITDESGTGALIFAGGAIGAATATTPSANANDTSVATTAYVQTELTAYASDTVTFTNKTHTDPVINGTITGTYTLGGTPTLNVITMGTMQASTAGTSIDFTGIPAGVKRITIMFSGVSTTGANNYLVQLGDSGGVETSGYTGSGSILANGGSLSANNSTAGLLFQSPGAGTSLHGTITLNLMNSATFLWTMTGMLGSSQSATAWVAGFSKALSAELDRVRITTVGGTDTFDAGNINIQYES